MVVFLAVLFRVGYVQAMRKQVQPHITEYIRAFPDDTAAVCVPSYDVPGFYCKHVFTTDTRIHAAHKCKFVIEVMRVYNQLSAFRDSVGQTVQEAARLC